MRQNASGAATTTTPAAVGSDSVGVATVAQVNQSIDNLLGDHERYRAVIDALQGAMANGDAAAVAKLVRYPIDVFIGDKRTPIRTEQEFAARYDQFVTPVMVTAITGTPYNEVLVNSQGVMLGTGEAWINGTCVDERCTQSMVKVVALQPGAHSQRRPR